MRPRWRNSVGVSFGLVALATAAGGACKKADPKQDETARVNRGTGAPPPTAPPSGTGEDEPADPSYQFMAQHPTAGPPGVEAVARFVVHPGAGYKMNKEFPTKLTLEPPPGVETPKTSLGIADAEAFSDGGLTFAVKLKATQAGEFTIPATLRFAVCTESTCDPKKKKVALVMKAE